MAVPWWAKVKASYYERPKPPGDDDFEDNGLRAGVAARSREMAGTLSGTRLGEQAQIGGAFANAGVPLSVAKAIDNQYRKIKAQRQVQLAQQAGIPATINQQQLDAEAEAERKRVYEEGGLPALAQGTSDVFNTVVDAVPLARDALSGAQGVAKVAASSLLEGLNQAFSPLMVPIALGRANETDPADQDRMARSFAESDPLPSPPGGDFEGKVDAWKFGLDFAEDFGRFFGYVPLTDSQQKDMRQAGYDPNSFGSRYAWYYDAFESGQRAVSDDDVRYFSQQYDPKSVQAVREIITSNFLNDGVGDTLSEEAQTFIATYQTGDPKTVELFDRMAKSSTLHIGSNIADTFGIPRGTEGSQIVSALGDLAIYWFADPTRGVAKGINAYRTASRGISAGRIASAENRLLELTVPGDITSAPVHEGAKQLDRLITAVDTNYRRHTNTLVGDPDAAQALNAAARDFERIAANNPTLLRQYGIVAQYRTGYLGRIGVVDNSAGGRDAAVKAAQRQQGQQFDALTYPAPDKPGKPLFELTYGADGKPTQESLNIARADLVDQMSLWIYADALATGRPIVKGQTFLPGEIVLGRQAMRPVRGIRDALINPKASIYKALDDRSGVVPLSGQGLRADEQIIGSATLGGYLRNNYTEKWARGWEKITVGKMDFSNMTISLSNPSGLIAYRRFVQAFLPRRLADVHVNKWAFASPAERKLLWDQTLDTIEAAGSFKNTKPKRDLFDQLRKGSTQLRPGSVGPNEYFTVFESDNLIKIGNTDVAAGLYPYQMNDFVTLPDIRLMRSLQEKHGLLSAVTGFFNSAPLALPTKLWKVGKVSNPANLSRQGAEQYTTQIGEQGYQLARELVKPFRAGKRRTINARLEANDTGRAIYRVIDNADDAMQRQIFDAYRTGDNVQYASALDSVAASLGATRAERDLLDDVAQEMVWYDSLARAGHGPNALQVARVLDLTRRVRLGWLDRTGANTPRTPNPHEAYLDQAFIDDLERAALGDISGSANDYLQLGDRAVDDIAELGQNAFGGIPTRIANARQLLGTAGDSGAERWFREFGARVNDPLPRQVMQAVAIENTPAGASTTAARVLNDLDIAAGLPPRFPPGVNTSTDIAEYLIAHHPDGATFRAMAGRLTVNPGSNTSAVGPIEQQAAYRRAAEAWERDLAYHMGAKVNAAGNDLERTATGLPVFNPDHNGILDKMARGMPVVQDDLSKVPVGSRPPEVSSTLYVPQVGTRDRQTLVRELTDRGGKLYQLTVARPLHRLANEPVFQANKSIALREMQPIMSELTSARYGLTPEQAASFLQGTAVKYATAATFRGTDQAYERSIFAAMSENFFMFQRAAEDFLRRFLRVTRATPTILSKGYLLMEAGQHAGWIYPQTRTDDDGNTETHLVFTYPGSDLMAKAFQETGQALGWGTDDLILKPLYSSMSSQVRFVNPSLSNPLGFSTSPMIGMPMRIVRDLFPETDPFITGSLSVMEGGGETYFAEQSLLQSWLPGPLNRLVPALFRDTADGQLASATRNAAIYYGAAGLLPPEGATRDQIESSNEAIIQMAQNQMVWRAAMGLFAPMAPGYDEPMDLGLPAVNAMLQVQGVRSIRGEWFEVLRLASEKYGSGPEAFSAASIEWLRRYPHGESILEPTAFQVGSTTAPGNAEEAGSISSGPQLTDWMINNRGWLTDNQTVAFYLLPSFAEPNFSPAGMRLQLRTEMRDRKPFENFMTDLRFQIGSREFWNKLKARNAEIASGRPKGLVYDEFAEWEKGWRATHPWTSEELNRRSDPTYVHQDLAPALQRVVESGQAPAGVNLDVATQVWNHYRDYREQYNGTKAGFAGQFDRARINKEYRDNGNQLFLNTPAETLWRAMDVYEVS